MGLRQSLKMSLLPYSSPYYARGAYPYAYGGAYPGAYGAYPYGPYGMTAEEIKKVREAEKKKYEDYVAPRRRPSRTPSLRRRSSPRSSALTPMAHTAPAHMVLTATATLATPLASPVATAMATLVPTASHTKRGSCPQVPCGPE